MRTNYEPIKDNIDGVIETLYDNYDSNKIYKSICPVLRPWRKEEYHSNYTFFDANGKKIDIVKPGDKIYTKCNFLDKSLNIVCSVLIENSIVYLYYSGGYGIPIACNGYFCLLHYDSNLILLNLKTNNIKWEKKLKNCGNIFPVRNEIICESVNSQFSSLNLFSLEDGSLIKENILKYTTHSPMISIQRLNEMFLIFYTAGYLLLYSLFTKELFMSPYKFEEDSDWTKWNKLYRIDFESDDKFKLHFIKRKFNAETLNFNTEKTIINMTIESLYGCIKKTPFQDKIPNTKLKLDRVWIELFNN